MSLRPVPKLRDQDKIVIFPQSAKRHNHTITQLSQMKNVLILLLLSVPFLAFSQKTEGTVDYTSTIKLEIELPPEMEEFRDKIPSTKTDKMVLHFNSEASLYKTKPVEEEEDDVIEAGSEESGMKIKFKRASKHSELYKEYASNKLIEQKELFGRVFLVTGETKQYKWKMTGKQKKILDYMCMQAVYKDSTSTVEAWFTPQIPVATGPSSYGQLPGLILEVSIDEGKRTLVANKVTLEKLEKDDLSKPKKGKKVTQAEFDEIFEKKMEEMKMEHGGGGMRFKIRH